MKIEMLKYDDERWIVEISNNEFTYHLVPSSKEIAEINKDALISFFDLNVGVNENEETKLIIESLKQAINEMKYELYQAEKNGLVKAALNFVEILEKKIIL